MYIYGSIGPWVGCGFDTIELIFPAPTVLGYDVCVTPIIQGSGSIIV